MLLKPVFYDGFEPIVRFQIKFVILRMQKGIVNTLSFFCILVITVSKVQIHDMLT